MPSSSLISQPPGLPAAAHLTTGSYSQTAGDDEACCKPNSAPYHADKFQMNRLFVAHVQCTLNLVIVISGSWYAQSLQFPVTQCVLYLLRNLWSRYVWLSDEYRQLKEVFRTNLSYVNLVAPPLSANKHRNRTDSCARFAIL